MGKGQQQVPTKLRKLSEVLTLDDAAALLMQLEPEDAGGWQRLEGALQRLAQGEGRPEGCRQHLRDAADRAGELAGGRVSDPASVIRALGVLLDQAITVQERPEPAQERVAEKSPDLSVSRVPADDAIADYMPQDLDPDLMSEFINESTDLIQNAEEALLTLEHDPEKKLGVSLVKSQAAILTDVGQGLCTQKQMRGGGQAVEASVRVSTQRPASSRRYTPSVICRSRAASAGWRCSWTVSFRRRASL
jgi:hypothetical protein